MKKLIFLCLLSMTAWGQTGIGTTTPDASAKLEVNASNKGFLPPRVTLSSGTDNTTIPNPATGLLIYNTGNNPNLVAGYYYWNGSNWATIATATGSGVYASYMRGSRTSAQTTGIAANGLVAFTQTDNVAGQDISLNTSTGQITLAAGRTYRLLAQVPTYQTSNSDTRPQFTWYNETNSSYIGSSSASYTPSSGAGWGATGGLSEAIITTSVTTTVSYRIIQPSNLNSIGGSGDFNTAGSYPWFDIQVISGNQAIEPDRVAKFVDAGVPLAFGDIQVQVSTSGGRSLQIRTTGGVNITGMISAYTTYNGASGTHSYTYFSDVSQTITSSFAYLGWSWGFNQSGDLAVYYFRDTTFGRFYRITLMIGVSYLNNMISIEKLI
ncbi:MAG: hypothetical protein ACKOXC_09330 [Aquirufa sp.]